MQTADIIELIYNNTTFLKNIIITDVNNNVLDANQNINNMPESTIYNFDEKIYGEQFLTNLINILNCICLKCANLLIKNRQLAIMLSLEPDSEHLVKAVSLCRKHITHCHTCGTPVYEVSSKIKNGYTYVKCENRYVKKRSAKQILSPQICCDIIGSIADDDWQLINSDPNKLRPEQMFNGKIVPPKPLPIIIPLNQCNNFSNQIQNSIENLISILKILQPSNTYKNHINV